MAHSRHSAYMCVEQQTTKRTLVGLWASRVISVTLCDNVISCSATDVTSRASRGQGRTIHGCLVALATARQYARGLLAARGLACCPWRPPSSAWAANDECAGAAVSRGATARRLCPGWTGGVTCGALLGSRTSRPVPVIHSLSGKSRAQHGVVVVRDANKSNYLLFSATDKNRI